MYYNRNSSANYFCLYELISTIIIMCKIIHIFLVRTFFFKYKIARDLEFLRVFF